MDSKLYSKIILLQLETTGTTNMIIKGSSMTPTLKNDDIITITKSEEYKSGDILVYLYKGNNILAHRLLFKKNDRYYCKGDNSFKMEDISAFQVIGKVLLVNNIPPTPWTPYKLRYSYYINRLYRYFKYDISQVETLELYAHYKSTVLSEDILDFTYGINDTCILYEYNETTICIYDTRAEKKYVFDKPEASILKGLTIPQSVRKLLNSMEIMDNDIPKRELIYAVLAKAIYLKIIVRF